MQCEQAEMLLAQLAFGELEAESDESRRLSAHLGECPACREKLGDLRVTTSLLREAIEAGPTPKLSAERQAALMRLTAEAQPAPSPSRVEATHQPRRRGYDVLCAVFRHRGVGIAASLGLLAVVGASLSPSLQRAREMSYRASVGEEFAQDDALHERGYFDDSTALYSRRLSEQVDTTVTNGAKWKDGDFDRNAVSEQRDGRRWGAQAGGALTADHYASGVESATARKNVEDLAAGKLIAGEIKASGRARGLGLSEGEVSGRGGQGARDKVAGATVTMSALTPLAAAIPSTGKRDESLSRSTRNYGFGDLSDQAGNRWHVQEGVRAGADMLGEIASAKSESEAKQRETASQLYRSTLTKELSEGLVREYVEGAGGAVQYGLNRFDAPSSSAGVPGQMTQGQAAGAESRDYYPAPGADRPSGDTATRRLSRYLDATGGEGQDWAYSAPSPADKPAGGATFESLGQKAPSTTAPPAEQPANLLGAFYKDFGLPAPEAGGTVPRTADKLAPAPPGPSATLAIRGTLPAEPQLQPPVDSLDMSIEKLDLTKSKDVPLDPFGGRLKETLAREGRSVADDAPDTADKKMSGEQLMEQARTWSEQEKIVALQRLHAGVEAQTGLSSADAGVVADEATARLSQSHELAARLGFAEKGGEAGTTTYDVDALVRTVDLADQNGRRAESETRQGLIGGAAIVNNRLIVTGSAQQQERVRQSLMARVEQRTRLGDEASRALGSTPEQAPETTTKPTPEPTPEQAGSARPGSQDESPLPDVIETTTQPRPAEVNPFVLTDRDAYSTFSIDVDTASYSQSRNFIRRGYLPPVQSVRVEEFVNAFDYNYPTQEREVFRVHSEASASPFGQGLTLLKVGVKGKALGRESRKPAHLVLVVDASGSMDKPDRLPLVRHALAALTRQLGERDTVSLVTYGTRAQLVLESAPATDHAAIIAALQSIQTGGSTNMIEGLQLGYEQARRAYRPHQINRVILCSDGVANVGAVDAQAMLDKVAAHRAQGIGLTCAGFGAGSYNDQLLEQLANRGDGAYVFVDSQAEANRVFVEQLAATIQNIARDVKIQVAFDPSRVRRYRLLGYENRDIADKDFRNDAVDAGEVGSGQAATALYEVELIDGPNVVRFEGLGRGRRADLGTVYVRYRDVERNEVQEIEHRLSADVVRPCTPRTAPRFYLAASAAQFAELLRLSRYAQEDGGFEQLEQVVAQVAEQLPLDGQVAELLELVRQCRRGLPRAK